MKQSLTKTLIQILQEEKRTTLILSELFDIKKLELLFEQAIKERDTEVLGEDKHRVTVMARCSKCRSYGNEGEYCNNDGKLITEKEELQWETIEETAYNKALSEIAQRQKETL